MTCPFPLPLMFTSWTWHSDGGSALGNVLHRVDKLKVRSVAVDLHIDELARFHVETLQDLGIFVVGWQEADSNTRQQLRDLEVDGWMPQVEGPDQLSRMITCLEEGVDLPKAVVTTFSGLAPNDIPTTATAARLKQLGLEWAFVECYAEVASHENIDAMLWFGTKFGFELGKMVPTIGTYRGELPGAYPQLHRYVPNIAYYLGEPMTDVQMEAFANVKPPPVPDPAELNRQIVELCDSWLTRFDKPQTKSRLRNIRRIAASSGHDPEWLWAQPAVTKALDSANL